MTQEKKTEDARRRKSTCATSYSVAKNRYEDECEMQFHDNGIVEARFVVVHGCMMLLLLLLYRRRVGDSWQARSRIVSPWVFGMGPLGACAALRCRTRAARCLFTASEPLGSPIIDGGYAIDNTHACIKLVQNLRMLRAV